MSSWIVFEFQIEKIVLFLLEQQGLLATRLTNLGEQHHALIQQPDGSRISELQEAYRVVGQEILRLLFFVEMNAIGIRKILKKFDKQFGHKFTDYYVKTRANHPYSQLRQVFKHVDPIIDSIKSAVDRLSNSTNFLHFLGRHAFIMDEELPTPSEDDNLDHRYHFMSLLLNLVNTFLYMVNTYIIVPTADNYSLSLGAAATVCGVVIGSMAVAQVFSSVYFSAWSNRSYLRPLVFSSIVLLVGNTLYALAYDLNSISVLLIGRLFCGLGSARAINRRYISDCVPLKLRMQASAGFVSASALGMACGPALACLLQTNFKIYKLTFNEETLPGWLMALAWLLYLLWLWVSFREPPRETKENLVPREANSGKLVNVSVENGSTQPLLMKSEAKQQDEDEDQELLPVNIIVGNYISNMFEERQVLLASEIMVFIGILLSFHVFIPYSVPQYVSSALITFVSAEVLEGVNLSLLSRVMSSRLSRGTYNGGLLSTEAGTLARVVADGTITLSGYLGESKLLNTTLLPSLLICISSIIATCFTYNSLY
uniref:SPX domain-containing protein n=1 Tax=Fagus sylvatica TaxID=28930 RepID=A0A2N9JBA8_FAGSY